MDPERLKKYSDEGVQYFYILTRVRKQFINYMNEMMRSILEERTTQATKLMGMALGLTETLMEEIYSGGLKPGIVEECKSLARNLNALIEKYPDLIWDLNVNTKGKHAHTFLTMFFSLIISKQLPWVGDKTIESITLGALLRDIGLLKIPPALREKDPLFMSTPDLLRYQDHPRLGAEMLAQVPKLCPQVIQIVLQHHEKISGDGFPLGLQGMRIYPLAKIISLADGLALIIIRNGLSPVEGLKNFLQDREFQARFDPVLIRALVAGFTDEEAA
jgi:response regulator RpfG family c-di-GMP phosphodiesterase